MAKATITVIVTMGEYRPNSVEQTLDDKEVQLILDAYPEGWATNKSEKIMNFVLETLDIGLETLPSV